MESIYDIAIIGAGPAGSTLAKELSKIDNLKIAIVDSRPLNREYKNNDFKKPCGGLLSPNAQKFLAKHNTTLPNEILADPQSFNIQTSDFYTLITRNYQRNYININREAFDRWLLKDILNVEKIFHKRVINIIYSNNIFITFLSSNEVIKSKMLIGADGANSIVKSIFFKDIKIKNYIAIQENFKKLDNSTNFSCYFDKEISNYYGWSFVKDHIFTIGYALKNDKKANEKFEMFKIKLKGPSINISESISREGTLLLRPNFFHGVSVGCDSKAYLIGEAGGYISPSSAEGISYAFNTAEILSKAIKNNIENENYMKIEKEFRLKMIKIQIKIFIKNIKSLFINTPFLRYLVMKIGLKSLKD